MHIIFCLSVCSSLWKDRIRKVEWEEENSETIFLWYLSLWCDMLSKLQIFFSLWSLVFHYVHYCNYWTTARLHKQEKSSFGFSDWFEICIGYRVIVEGTCYQFETLYIFWKVVENGVIHGGISHKYVKLRRLLYKKKKYVCKTFLKTKFTKHANFKYYLKIWHRHRLVQTLQSYFFSEKQSLRPWRKACMQSRRRWWWEDVHF